MGQNSFSSKNMFFAPINFVLNTLGVYHYHWLN